MAKPCVSNVMTVSRPKFAVIPKAALFFLASIGLTACNGSSFSSGNANKPAITQNAPDSSGLTTDNQAAAAGSVPSGINVGNTIGNGAACNKKMAVALVMDVSMSMRLSIDGKSLTGIPDLDALLGSNGPGPTKLDVAKQAAQSFVGKFTSPDDMIGLVEFSDQATILSAMSKDRPAVTSAIGQMQVIGSTNIPSGLTQGGSLFANVPTDYMKILILMSDGQNRAPGDPVATAATIKQSGVVVMTMGYAALDGQSDLKAMASDPSYYFDSTDSEGFLKNFDAVSAKLCR